MKPRDTIVKISLNGYVHRMEKKRRYRLRERAKQQEETRRRIVEATAALHAEVGPAATTISAIAERAGVQRLTVYRHFPEEQQLFEACSALSEERHPSPDPAQWQDITDPGARTETTLTALYRYYAGDARGLALVLRDAEELPALREVLTPFLEYLTSIADDIASTWTTTDVGHEVRALAGLAVDFRAWQALAEQGVAPDDAARLMTRVIHTSTAG